MGCRDPNKPPSTLPSKLQDDEPPNGKRIPLEGACRGRKRQVSFDPSIEDTPGENLSTDAYDRIEADDGTDKRNDVDLVALEGTQDRGFHSEGYESEAISNEDC